MQFLKVAIAETIKKVKQNGKIILHKINENHKSFIDFLSNLPKEEFEFR